MKFRNLNIGLVLGVVAVVLQTTVFDRYLDPFGVAPDFVLLIVVAASYHLSEEAAMLLGFSAGLLTDLLGNTLLGLWALVLTVAAYATVRVRYRVEGNPFLTLASVFVLTILGELLFAVLGTLFGQQVFSDVNALKKVLLAAVYNLLLAVLVLPLVGRFMQKDPAAGVWAS